MKISNTIIGLTFTIVFIGNVYAISKEKHKIVTEKSFNAYANCINKLGIEDTLIGGSKLIAEATVLEDESPLIQRYLNWHFYDVYKDTEYSMGRSATGARKSLHHIYNERTNSLIMSLNDKNNNDIYEYSGRLVHYVQDMTVPAHVAPIYHFKFFYLGESDYFDTMSEWESTVFIEPNNLCEVNYSGITGLKNFTQNILDETAKHTIERIRENIPVSVGHSLEGKSWEEFWTLRNPENDASYTGVKYGFAPYGSQGRTGFQEFCEKGKDICLNFFHKSYNKAVESTVKVLLYINAANTN